MDATPNLVINADDCGMQLAFNNAILLAAREGVLTSTSVCATGPAVDDALSRVFPACPGLGAGIHLCLTVGRGLTAGMGRGNGGDGGLFSADGSFRPCLNGFVWLRAHPWPSAALTAAVKAELRAQFEALLPRLPLDHADSHHHAHMIPWVFDIVLDLCREYRVPFVRLTAEPLTWGALRRGRPGILLAAHYANMRLMAWADRRRLARAAKGAGAAPGPAPRSNSAFCGLIHSGRMDEREIAGFLAENPGAGVAEILLHPARLDPAAEAAPFMSEEMRATIHAPGRETELQALLAPGTRAAVAASGYRLTNYRELARSLQTTPDNL